MAQAKRIGFFDLESDGLLDELTKIHCLSVAVNDEPVLLFHGDKVAEGLAILNTCDEVVAHNGIAFDLMALAITHKFVPKGEVFDTFIAGCLFFPDIDGGNSLGEWGARLGCPKDDYQERAIARYQAANPGTSKEDARRAIWREYEPEMGSYCIQDTITLRKLYYHLREFQRSNPRIDWTRSLWLEHEFAKAFAVQGKRGVFIDQPVLNKNLDYLATELQRIQDLVEPLLPARKPNKGELDDLTPPKNQFKKNGEPSANVLKWFDRVWCPHADGDATCEPGVWLAEKWGEVFKLPTPANEDGSRLPLRDTVAMTLANQTDIKRWLMDCGWQPTMWSYKKEKDKRGKMRIVRGDDGQPVPTNPKFHDKGEMCPNLEAINVDFPLAKDVVRWMILRHRQGFLQSIKDNIRADGRVRADGFALGTPTARVTHRVVANTPKCDPAVVFGKECREVFSVPEGRDLGGVDASGLELRMLAHYIADPGFNNTIIHGKKEDGTEIHTLLWTACKAWVPSRNVQKNVTYGFLYGASDRKLAETAGHGPNAEIGAEIRNAMIKGINNLEKLMENCDKAGKAGYLIAIDGRRIEIRSKHAVLNTLLQSAGSITVKLATIYMVRQIKAKRTPAMMVIHYHDEVVLEGTPAGVREAGQYFIDGLRWAEQKLKITCPLDGEAKFGKSWADVH